jgi:hypothetical protein
MAWKIYEEAIDMVQRRHRYFPYAFCWRGRHYQVDTVERSWLGKRRHPDRRFFQVRCGEGLFEIYQDLAAGTWHLRRARLLPASARALGSLIPVWR